MVLADVVNKASTIRREHCRRLDPRRSDGSGVRLASVEVRATIVKAAVVRQASGWQRDDDAPTPQITRRGPTVLVEFQ